MSESNAKQADFPEGATVLPNPIGTAPGFEVKVARRARVLHAGRPAEMKRMFDEQVVPRIRDIAPNDSHQIRLRTFGAAGERRRREARRRRGGVPRRDHRLPRALPRDRGEGPRARARPRVAHARSPGSADPQAIVRELAERAAQEVRARLGDIIYGEGDDTFAGVVGRALRTRGWTLAIAESCTGGLVGHMLTKEPGASDYLLLDAVTYANSAKQAVLGVDEDVLRGHGAVSAEVAGRMAEGARRVSGADVALAITGIAGPARRHRRASRSASSTSRSRPRTGTDVKERNFPGDRALDPDARGVRRPRDGPRRRCARG